MVSWPCSSIVSLPNDAARCWLIPGAEGGYSTASFSRSWEKHFSSYMRRLLYAKGWLQLCLSSCDTGPSLICVLTSQYPSPCKSTLLYHGKQAGIVWGFRKSMRECVLCHTSPAGKCRLWYVLITGICEQSLLPGAEISQSCTLGLWWAQDDRKDQRVVHALT